MEELSIGNTGLSAENAWEVIDSAGNLKGLDLTGTKINSDLSIAITALLNHGKLDALILDDAGLTSSTLPDILEAIANRGMLLTLSLRKNPFRQNEIELLSNFLSGTVTQQVQFPAIQYLDLRKIEMTYAQISMLSQAMAKNPYLKKVTVDSPLIAEFATQDKNKLKLDPRIVFSK